MPRAPRDVAIDGNLNVDQPDFMEPGSVDAVPVVGAWLHHRLVRAVERRMHPPRPDSQAALGEVLGVSELQMGRRLRGDAYLNLEHLAGLVMLYGVDLLQEWMPDDDESLFPPDYRNHLGAWCSGRGELPTFAVGPPGLREYVTELLIAECAQRAKDVHLTAGGLLAGTVVPAVLRHSGKLPMWVEQNLGAHDRPTIVDVTLGSATDTVLCVGCIPDSRLGSPSEQLHATASLIGAMFRCASARMASRRFTWLVVGDAGLDMLRSRDSALDFHAPTGDRIVSSTVVNGLEAMAHPPLSPQPQGVMLHISWVRTEAGALHVISVSIDKIETLHQ